MTSSSMTQLARDLTAIGAAGGANPGGAVERYLESVLEGCSPQERLMRLEGLARELEGQGGAPATTAPAAAMQVPSALAGGGGQAPCGASPLPAGGGGQAPCGASPLPVEAAPEYPAPVEMQALIGRFLGQVSTEGLSAQELLDQFTLALDTLFDSLNQIVSTINVTLLGESPELETIRKVIGSNLKSDSKGSIKEYLERIQKAFLVAHKSFQGSAATLIQELLTELDPQALANAKSSGLKFGPLRKAELFEQYEEKYGRCQRWFASGQYRERLLREFEKQCQSQFDAR